MMVSCIDLLKDLLEHDEADSNYSNLLIGLRESNMFEAYRKIG